MKRDTRTAYRARQANTERSIDAAVAEVKADRDAAWDAAKSKARKHDTERRRLTREEIEGASLIHDGRTWRKVVRVNAKSVSVESGYSWVDRVPFDKIHAVQPPMFAMGGSVE